MLVKSFEAGFSDKEINEFLKDKIYIDMKIIKGLYHEVYVIFYKKRKRFFFF